MRLWSWSQTSFPLAMFQTIIKRMPWQEKNELSTIDVTFISALATFNNLENPLGVFSYIHSLTPLSYKQWQLTIHSFLLWLKAFLFLDGILIHRKTITIYCLGLSSRWLVSYQSVLKLNLYTSSCIFTLDVFIKLLFWHACFFNLYKKNIGGDKNV